MIDEKYSDNKLKEISQVRIFVERNGNKIILSDSWKLKGINVRDNTVDGRSSGICYPNEYLDLDIHAEVAINGIWVRLW